MRTTRPPFLRWVKRSAVAAALKEVYRAKDADAGAAALDAFAEGPWGEKYRRSPCPGGATGRP